MKVMLNICGLMLVVLCFMFYGGVVITGFTEHKLFGKPIEDENSVKTFGGIITLIGVTVIPLLYLLAKLFYKKARLEYYKKIEQRLSGK